MKRKPAIDRLRSAGTTLVLDHPFFGILKTKMDYREAVNGKLPNGEELKMMATDGIHIYYNGPWVDSVDDEEILTTVAHEVLHPAMLHHVRSQGHKRDHRLWQQACDYAINPILKDAKFTMKPGEWLLDDAFRGKTAEQIYDILKKRPKAPQGGKDKDKQKQGGGSGQQQPQQGGSDDGEQPPQPGQGNGPGEGQGNQQPEPPQPEDRGQVIDAQDQQTQEAEWTVSLNQAAKASAMHGNLPAGMEFLIEQTTKPRVDWRAILRRWAQQLAAADYSYKMPNRRYVSQGLYLPQIKSEQMPAIVLVYDSSGSTMSVAPIFLAEVQSVFDEVMPAALYLVMCDAVVQSVQKFERGDLIDVKVKGLGGTDFRDPFLWAQGKDTEEDHGGYYKRPSSILPLEEDIAGMIYLTDAEGRYPAQAPEFEVLWAITTDYKPGSTFYPPFGEVVKIEEYDT